MYDSSFSSRRVALSIGYLVRRLNGVLDLRQSDGANRPVKD